MSGIISSLIFSGLPVGLWMLNLYQREFVSQGTLPTDNNVWNKISFGVSQFFAWIISSIKITRLTIEKE